MTYQEKLEKARKLRDLLWGKTQKEEDKSSETESDDKKGSTEPSDGGDDTNESK